MKNKMVMLITLLTVSAAGVMGCGSTAGAPVEPEAQETSEAAAAEISDEDVAQADAVEAASTSEEENTVGMANPWVEITEGEAQGCCDRLFKAPDGAQDQVWMKCEELGNPDKGIGPLIQLGFSLDGMNFTARAQQGAAEDADIAGNYVEWTVGPDEATMANWGGGNMVGKTYRSVNDTGYVDMITWYDMEIGIAYSLSVAAADLDGFDIQAVAEQMYSEDNEPFTNMPNDFLEEQSGKTSFESYDEVISELTEGQGYAYIKLTGCEDELLAVTDLVFEYDHSAYQASIYGKQNGEVVYLGQVTGNGSSCPLRLEDGIIYAGTNHTYETYFISDEYNSVMMKDMISDGIDSGANEFSGFTRENNSYEDTLEYTGGQEEFDKLMSEREHKPIIEFTPIGE
ncbi:hypothetical protein [Butyrivibrio sp. MB2005]|uniref:hypothetical protein n=1 Tax=Butyrivibrio sp. MB2005 TaxID=1280678 RepID=UPI00042594C7|nr:hypothetical protein [Butyrivibrio sp. MB2005]